ncbi:OpgC domain-containing protein [Gordonia sp. CPCC 206044]|uniref:OpgC domain-containing protein n=1 Tax=Gordonia sp. CPCC 206044 TaxID=3140793 RepID=UPI003AF34442
MNRDLAIDATRGLAIWSMISLHFAAGTYIAAPTHSFPYVDGMSAFVLLSGLVLGLVYRRWIERVSLRHGYWRLTKRIAVLYVCQLTIALVAVAAAMAGHRWLTLLLPIDGWRQGVELSLTMQYLPSGGNILLLYMVLMASAYLLFPMLMRGWWVMVLGASFALYIVSLVWSPDWFYLTAHMAGPRIQNWAGWQIMFVPAVVLGWKWRDWHVPEIVDRWLPVIVAVAVGVALFFHFGFDAGPWARFEPDIADKLDFRPARAIGAWVAVPAIYGIFRLALRLWHKDWLRPLVMTGTRSLDSYVLQAIALVIVPIHVAHRPWSAVTTTFVVLLVFGLCWAWAEFRRAYGIDKLHRLPVIIAQRVALWRRGPTPETESRPHTAEPVGATP